MSQLEFIFVLEFQMGQLELIFFASDLFPTLTHFCSTGLTDASLSGVPNRPASAVLGTYGVCCKWAYVIRAI
jgi:hypothetical protein